MSKQLEKLTEKALRTGFANLNGRYYIYYQGYSEKENFIVSLIDGKQQI